MEVWVIEKGENYKEYIYDIDYIFDHKPSKEEIEERYGEIEDIENLYENGYIDIGEEGDFILLNDYEVNGTKKEDDDEFEVIDDMDTLHDFWFEDLKEEDIKSTIQKKIDDAPLDDWICCEFRHLYDWKEEFLEEVDQEVYFHSVINKKVFRVYMEIRIRRFDYDHYFAKNAEFLRIEEVEVEPDFIEDELEYRKTCSWL